MGNYINGTIRFDSKLQRRRLKEAAEKLHWSLNRFLLVASTRLADEVLNDNQAAGRLVEQLIDGGPQGPGQLTLNQ